jgi:hypothetical protein
MIHFPQRAGKGTTMEPQLERGRKKKKGNRICLARPLWVNPPDAPRQRAGTDEVDLDREEASASQYPNQPGYCLVPRECLYPLQTGVHSLGRASDCTLVINDMTVSRRHCQIVVRDDQVCELHDTGATHGTHLNGDQLTGPVVLQPGAEIHLGGQVFVFLALPTPGPAQPLPVPE